VLAPPTSLDLTPPPTGLLAFKLLARNGYRLARGGYRQQFALSRGPLCLLTGPEPA